MAGAHTGLQFGNFGMPQRTRFPSVYSACRVFVPVVVTVVCWHPLLFAEFLPDSAIYSVLTIFVCITSGMDRIAYVRAAIPLSSYNQRFNTVAACTFAFLLLLWHGLDKDIAGPQIRIKF
eukprot:TRINITY_DN119886_c0_g2_i2.p1 TRINITY_DN119886_c0_g2~~TRINITY_DN119886_c0_g2_i2.p1  ORF type:complete len:120 (-),score=3.23 TRINITY_DN119886_c0_g2_i2:76-435(-)